MTGGHGHVKPRSDGARARCGGPTICGECALELANLMHNTRIDNQTRLAVNSQPPPPSLAPGEAGQRVEAAMDRLAELVTEHGPKPLVRGMPSYLAHEAIVACIERLVGPGACNLCSGEGWVCENHRNRAWNSGEGCCGGAGAPCKCNPLWRPRISPDDFRHLITNYLPATPSYDLAKAITNLLNERLKL